MICCLDNHIFANKFNFYLDVCDIIYQFTNQAIQQNIAKMR